MRLGVRVFRRSAGLRRNIGLALRISSVGACVLLALLFAQVAHATVVGKQGPKYAVSGSAAKTIKNPTLTGPESKLWYKDGRWWGVLWDRTSGSHHIFWLNRSTPTHHWVDSGVLVDGRNTVRVDALSAGPKLWVATHVYGVDGGRGKARLYRYSYHSASHTYTRDNGFPVRINSAISKTLVITKEIGHNVLWASWVEQVVPGRREVLVAKGRKGGKKWGAPFRVPGSRTVGYDDISSIVAFGKKVGVLWSDSNNGDGNRFRFATHRDRARSSNWSLERPYLTGRRMVDDHISLKSWNGRVYAAVKDASRGINIDGPILILLVREPNGHWQSRRNRFERRRPHASRSSHRPGRERAPRVRKRAELQARHDLREDVAAGRAVVRRSGAANGVHLRRSRAGARGGDVDEAAGEPIAGACRRGRQLHEPHLLLPGGVNCGRTP